MNKRKAIAAANAALPPEIKVHFNSEWNEWQVSYPHGKGRDYAPASDYDDAVGTARDIAKRLGFSMRGDGPLTTADFESIQSAFISYGGYA